MYTPAKPPQPSTPGNRVGSIVADIFLEECGSDGPRIVIPRPELHLAVRFQSSTSRELDIHVLGSRQRVIRKTVRSGQWTILARLQLAHARAVLGVPPFTVDRYVVPLDQVWGVPEAQKLHDRLLGAASPTDAAQILEQAIVAKISPDNVCQRHSALVVEAAKRLLGASVSTVALDLGMSERHLRRVFLETTGTSPKTFARLMRFSRATDLARESHRASWADIAVAADYYDQAHLIEDFHAFAGATPETFLRELCNTSIPKRAGSAPRS